MRHSSLRSSAAAVAAAAAIAGATPGSSARADGSAKTLIAFVAANAAAPFDQIIGAFERAHPAVLVTPEYAGTQVLETQAEQGAPFDVFVSADRTHIDALHREGLVGEPVLLSQGHEVIVVPAGNPAGIRSLRDLADKPAKLVLGDANVPIGIYSRRVLDNASKEFGSGFSSRVLGHVVSFETNVKQVLEKVALGEADAGIVYFTDVTPAFEDKVDIVPIPGRFEVEAANYIAVAAQSKNGADAADLAAFATGPEGRRIFQRNGYDPLP